MNLQADHAFASECLEGALLVIFGQRAGFAVPMADLQTVDPRRDLRIFPGAADAGGVPIVYLPGFELFLLPCRCIHRRWPAILGASIGLRGEPLRPAVRSLVGGNLEGVHRKRAG